RPSAAACAEADGVTGRPSADEHPRVAEHTQPRGILAPADRRPAQVGRAQGAFGMRHQDGGAAVLAGQAGSGAGRAVGVGRIARGRRAVGLDVAQRGARGGLVEVAGELGPALAVRDHHRDTRTGHAAQEQRRRFDHLQQPQARLELLAAVAQEGGPVPGAGDYRLELAEHLAAVADTQAEAVVTGEERRELLAQPRALQDAGGPAAARAKHVAIAEATAGSQALEAVEGDAAGDQVAHVHVERLEAGAVERGGHLDLAVDALLAQDRDLRTRAADVDGTGDERRRDVLGRVEHEFGAQPRGGEVARRHALLVGALGVVAQALHRVAGRPPGVEQLVPAPFGQGFAVLADAYRRRRRRPGNALGAV